MKITSILAFAVLAAMTIGLGGTATAAAPCCQSCGQSDCQPDCQPCCETSCETSCQPSCRHGGCHGGCRARRAAYQNCIASWYGSYSHVGWGAPLTLLVPPTAKYQTNWGWGVGNTRIGPIYPQFARGGYATGAYGSGQHQTTPLWPRDTTQFGVYYARGPW